MKSKIKVLLADDDPILRRLLPRQLPADTFVVSTVSNGEEAFLALGEEGFDVVLLDVNLPDVSGLDVLSSLRQLDDAPEVIMLTADTTLTTGLEAMRLGAYDYITKPAAPEQIEVVIRKATEKHNLVQQNARLRAAVRQQNPVIQPAHQSKAMREVFIQAERVARINTTVLITGESGTGKDVMARWIHSKSPRAELPLVSINCGAVPENLFESEFFGHEKGAFTGANAQKIGFIEAADGSTLFLDEIGEMPITVQVKLLHFLENQTFRRVGANRDRQTDVRVIAATNRPLEEDIKKGHFRLDLFYRLNIISFHLPPLRERKEDIPALIEYFLNIFRHKFNRPRLRLSEQAKQFMINQRWPGNIRELKNTLERTAILSPTDEITEIYGLPQANAGELPSDADVQTQIVGKPLLPLAEIEKQHILYVLEKVRGKRERAAAILGITSRTLYRKLNEFSNETLSD
jgi:DNA-binding NtrC family response regulator